MKYKYKTKLNLAKVKAVSFPAVNGNLIKFVRKQLLSM